MKAKDGYIRLIDGKVKFEYYELLEPDRNKFWNYGRIKVINRDKPFFDGKLYSKALKEYEASKRTIEVSNVKWPILVHPKIILKGEKFVLAENNQPCKAEVNGKAVIVELIK